MAPALVPCLWKNARKGHNRETEPTIPFPYIVLCRPNHCLNPAFVPVPPIELKPILAAFDR